MLHILELSHNILFACSVCSCHLIAFHVEANKQTYENHLCRYNRKQIPNVLTLSNYQKCPGSVLKRSVFANQSQSPFLISQSSSGTVIQLIEKSWIPTEWRIKYKNTLAVFPCPSVCSVSCHVYILPCRYQIRSLCQEPSGCLRRKSTSNKELLFPCICWKLSFIVFLKVH